MTDLENDNLAWLTEWYAAQCDEDWEHTSGVTIETIDNPGWTLKIDLSGTELDGRPFETMIFNSAALDGNPTSHWHHCKVEGSQFRASGGARDLATLIGIFRNWAAA